MSFVPAPQVESRVEFSPIPLDIEQGQAHDEQNIQDKFDNIVEMEPCEEEGFDVGSLVIILRIALIGTLLLGLALSPKPLLDQSASDNSESLDFIEPKIFLDSFHVPQFKVSEGELSSTWNLTLTIYNPMNSSKINILKLDATITYKGNESLAVATLILPQDPLDVTVFPLEAEEKRRVALNFSTTGWEEDQPIVDDTVVQSIMEDMKRGDDRFGLEVRVYGEVVFADGWVSGFDMSPKCNDLEVQFLVGDEKKKKDNEVAIVVDPKPRECVGHATLAPPRDSLYRY